MFKFYIGKILSTYDIASDIKEKINPIVYIEIKYDEKIINMYIKFDSL